MQSGAQGSAYRTHGLSTGGDATHPRSYPDAHGASSEGADTDVVLQLLGQVGDPEVPVLSILDLGIVRSWQKDENGVEVVITPTYSGCPAMDTIEAYS